MRQCHTNIKKAKTKTALCQVHVEATDAQYTRSLSCAYNNSFNQNSNIKITLKFDYTC